MSLLVVAPAHGAPTSTAALAAIAEPAAFTPVSPVRVLDTRNGNGPVGPTGTVTLDLSSAVPASTTAVVLNVTGTEPTANTYVTAYPSGGTRPTASNLNLTPGETRPNLVTVAIGADRKVVLYNNAGTVHLIADLAGYYAATATGRYNTYAPVRALDTRTHSGPRPPGPVGPGGVVTLDLSDLVPDSATAVTFNLTGTDATSGTFVTAWPTDRPRPTASNLNLTAGATTPNQVVVELGTGNMVSLYNNSGDTHLIVDVAGFYTPDYGSLFTPVTPTRVLDTRNSTGGVTGPIGVSQLNFGLGSIVPTNATGVVMNLTGTQVTANTYVTAWPAVTETQPFTSNLNLSPGQTAANLTTVGLGMWAYVALWNNAGTVQLIADLAGYFSLPPLPCANDCVVSWGSNEYGALGTGNYDPTSATPAQVYGLSDVTAVAASTFVGYALRADGTVWAWGYNGFGDLGNGWRGGKSVVPVPVEGLDDVVAINAAVALKSDGTVWAWGPVPAAGGFYEPEQVPGLTDVTAVAGTLSTGYALKSDGTVWAWGSNGFGSLGNGSTVDYTAQPVQVSGLTGVVQINSDHYGAMAIKSDGTLWAWGDNRQGQLGNGTVGGDGCYNFPPTGQNCYSNVPVQVLNLTDVTAIGGGSTQSFAVLGDGSAWAWGNNHHGALGNGQDCDNCATGTPVRIAGLTNATAIDGNENGGYAVDADGRVWAWGANDRDGLGPVNPVPYSTVPVRLSEPTGVTTVVGGLQTGIALVP